jgi:flagellar M-ring protein FliF
VAEKFKVYFDNFRELWSKFTVNQKLALTVVSTALFLFFLMLIITRQGPSYTLLYSNLSLEDAGEITAFLNDQKIPFQIGDGGTAILIPGNKVYETRMALAAKGLPDAVETGYEIFDRNNLGITEFVQKLNYQRALEGELARTIQKLSEVTQARVHLVMARETLFREDEVEPSASLVLQLAGGRKLRSDQIYGISHLVAGSVSGLSPDNITIIDTYGRLLSQGNGKDENTAVTSSQLDIKQNIESYLENKAATLLEGVLGANKATVRVSTELDFERVDKTIETYDPNGVVLRSEERKEVESPENGEKSENTISNFEINRTIQHVVESVGGIKKLTAAVVVDGRYEEGEEGRTYVPLSAEEMRQLKVIVQNAIGYDEARGDEVEVINLPFDTSFVDQQKQEMEQQKWWSIALFILRKLPWAIAIVAGFIFLRRLMKKLPALLNLESRAQKQKVPEVDIDYIPSEEDVRREKIQREVQTLASDKPEDAARLIRTWMTETVAPKKPKTVKIGASQEGKANSETAGAARG